MATKIIDSPANANEYISHAAKILGKGAARPAVFDAIYAGKKQVKTVKELMKATGLKHVRVLQEAGKLAANDIVEQVTVDGKVAYEKIPFFQHHKKKIRDLAGDTKKLKAYPTKRSGGSQGPGQTVKVTIKVDRAKIRQITLNDIDSFAAVKSVAPMGDLPKKVAYEKKFKAGLQRIAGQAGKFKDWGGETNDLFTTRIVISGRRQPVAFALKGRGTSGTLKPGMMGKNGDQIQRLFESPAKVFILQYWQAIDQSVLRQMEMLAVAKSVFTGGEVLYGVIDGVDSNRLYEAYKKKF